MARAFRAGAILAAVLWAAAPSLAQEAPPAAAQPAAAQPAQPAAAEAAAPATRGGPETIKVTADTSKGYARILFKWSSPVGYDASIAEGVLIVRFDRAFRLPPDQVKLPLDAYVSVIKLDADGRTLKMSLNGKVRLHASAGGPLVAIDLVPASVKDDPPDIVDPTVRPPPKGPIEAKLKIAVEQDRTRLIFEWGEEVDYEAKVADGKISAVFKRGGSIDVSRLQKNPPAFVRGATASGGDDKVLLEIKIDPGSKVEHRRDKTRTVFEVMAPANDKDGDTEIVVPEEIAAAAAPEPAHDEPKPEDAAAGHEEPPPAEAKPEEAHGEAKPEEAHAEAKPDEAKPGEAKPDDPKPDEAKPDEAKPDAAHEDGAHEVAGEHADEHAAEPPAHEPESPDAGHETAEPADAAGHESEHAAAEGEGHGDAVEPGHEDAHADAHDGAPADEHGEGHGAETAEALPAEPPAFAVTRSRNEIDLLLPVLVNRPAAMCKRGSTAFIVLPGEAAIDAAAIQKENLDIVTSANVRHEGSATIVEIGLAGTHALTAGQRGGAWTATLSPDPLDPPRPIALLRDARTVGPAKARATMTGAAAPIEMTDPASGERLIVVPASGEPQGVIGARSYVDFAADSSAQGLVIRPFVDDLTVTPDEQEVLIASPGGLTLSAGTVSDYAPEREALGDMARPAAMEFEAWAGEGDFLEERSRLVNAIDPEGSNIEHARLDLARFYLAHDLGAEALGMLQLMVRDDEAIVGDPAFRALRGAALLLLDRPALAMDDLGSASLDDDQAAQLFRAVGHAALGEWGAARDAAVEGEAAIASFRADWQGRFRVAGARGAVETNAVDVAERMLAAVPKDGVPRGVALEAELLRGELAQRLKRDAEALRLFAEVREAGYRPLAVRATLAEIVLKEQTGAMKAPEAIKALDELRWQWRGDALELTVLHRLGSLQIAAGDYRDGLQTLRAAVLGFPNQEETRRIGLEMSAVFEDLFLHGKADALPPIQALGLYYDFKELTPIGTLGDEMVRRLADRLIAVDLLEQAAELLQHQVDRRLDGVAKAQIAAKLAAVYLMDRKPEKALVALRTSAQTRLPDDLAAQRRLLAGRALSDLKQYDAALDSFEQDDTPEARRLRADVLWSASRWVETAAAVEILIAGRETDPKPLDAEERYDVMRAAVAYTMADDKPGLDGLRRRFVVPMAETPEAAAFEVITRAVDPSGVAFRDTAKAIATTDTLDAFLQSLGLGRPAPGTAENAR